MQIGNKYRALAEEAERELFEVYSDIDAVARRCTERVLDSFRTHRVSEAMFAPTTGYGYGDVGRDAIDAITAEVFGAKAAFMRPALISGTHAITVGLFALLRPGDVMLSVTGKPYDTLHDVIGITGKKNSGSLKDFGVEYDDVPFTDSFDYGAIQRKLEQYGDRVKVVFLQRSKGYQNRKTLSPAEIGEVADFVRRVAGHKLYVVVDNCYGEFTDDKEPTAYGADMIIGSLIKNPGGGMADIGGYIAGTEEAVELAGNRLCCPGVGLEAGASLGQNRNMLRGLFYAPHTVAQAMKTAHLAAYMFKKLGYKVSPDPFEHRYDIIQTVELGSPEGLIGFCRGIQSASPVDAYLSPEPWEMPGYADPVIMAAGAFVGGASIELSADGPMREPYTAFLQGGLTYESARLGIMAAAEYSSENNG